MHVGKLAPIIPILQKQLNISLTQAGLALSLVQAAGMLFALSFGVLSEKLGLKKCFIAGLVILGCASISGVLVNNIYSLFLFRFFEGIGFLLITLTAPAILKRICDPTTLNMKMGFWGSYMGLGVGIAMLSIPLLLQYFSWQMIWLILGLLCFVLALIISQRLSLPITHHSTLPVQTSTTHSFQHLLKITITHPPIVCLAVIFACYTSQWLTVIGFLPSIYLSHQIELRSAGTLTAFVSIANIIGTLAAGILLHHRFQPKTLMRYGFGTMLLMSWLTFCLPSHLTFGWQYLSIALFSAIGGFIPATVFAISLHYAPQHNAIAASVGLILQVSALAQFLLPPFSALLVSYTHNWSNIGWITTVLSTLGLTVVWQLFKKHPYPRA
ncbi:CynX/NimT family MFS transporter [Acinetobacter sp. ANC 4648]|uniref:MFS transporter n=1 Tax=Acinetobacter sp. ANC 4648 TaxID=1977875 RepID=UPI003A4C708D